MKKHNSLFFLVFLIIFSDAVFSQKKALDSFSVMSIKADRYKKDYCPKKINRSKNNLVTLTFFNFFQDSISVYLENNLIFTKKISKDTSTISTDYTGFAYVVEFPFRNSNLSIVLLNKKLRNNVRLKQKYPVYLISNYNGVFYVSPRKCLPELK